MNKQLAILDTQLMFSQGVSFYINKMFQNINVNVICQDVPKLFTELALSQIDIVLMELNISELDGIDVISDIKKEYPHTKVIIISAYNHSGLVKNAMIAGADAYLIKSNDISEIQEAIHEVLNGKVYLGDTVRLTPCKLHGNTGKHIDRDPFILRRTLTKREKEVLSCMVAGDSTKETSQRLFISNSTVLVHKKNIMKKLKVNNTANMLKVAKIENLV